MSSYNYRISTNFLQTLKNPVSRWSYYAYIEQFFCYFIKYATWEWARSHRGGWKLTRKSFSRWNSFEWHDTIVISYKIEVVSNGTRVWPRRRRRNVRKNEEETQQWKERIDLVIRKTYSATAAYYQTLRFTNRIYESAVGTSGDYYHRYLQSSRFSVISELDPWERNPNGEHLGNLLGGEGSRSRERAFKIGTIKSNRRELLRRASSEEAFFFCAIAILSTSYSRSSYLSATSHKRTGTLRLISETGLTDAGSTRYYPLQRFTGTPNTTHALFFFSSGRHTRKNLQKGNTHETHTHTHIHVHKYTRAYIFWYVSTMYTSNYRIIRVRRECVYNTSDLAT